MTAGGHEPGRRLEVEPRITHLTCGLFRDSCLAMMPREEVQLCRSVVEWSGVERGRYGPVLLGMDSDRQQLMDVCVQVSSYLACMAIDT